MKKTKMIFSAILAAIAFNSLAVQAESCDDIINDAINYLQTTESGYNRYVGFEVTSLKAPAKFVSFGSGALQVGGLYPSGKFLFAKDIKVLFSDRTWCPELGAGLFCTGYQPFNFKKADVQQIYLSKSNAKIVLSTWGNATYNVPLQCSNGFLYGVLAEANGNSMLVISLKKDKLSIPK